MAWVLSIVAHAAPQAHGERPPWQNAAAMARWLVHTNDWGTISTVSRRLSGSNIVPFANAVSYSDGPHGKSTGRLLFYLTKLDATAHDLEANSKATLSVAEAQLPHACRGVDPEDPTCAKVSITGAVEPVRGKALPEALRLLFARHPAMKAWPADHGFQLYEMHIEAVRLLDFYGGAKDISPKDYFAADLFGRDFPASM